jgi:hypothetical protein
MLYSLWEHLWPVLYQKLWYYNNMCINNDYFVNKLSTFVFQNISILIHCNSILNEILFRILHLHIITWKWQEQGLLFQVHWGPKEFLKLHWLQNLCSWYCFVEQDWSMPTLQRHSSCHIMQVVLALMWSWFIVASQVTLARCHYCILGHSCTVGPYHCCTTMSSNNDLGSFCCNVIWDTIVVQHLVPTVGVVWSYCYPTMKLNHAERHDQSIRYSPRAAVAQAV